MQRSAPPGPSPGAGLAATLVTAVTDATWASYAAETIQHNLTELAAAPTATLVELVDVIAAKAKPADPTCLQALRELVAVICKFKIDTTVKVTDWQTAKRLADAMHRWLAEPAILEKLETPHTGKGDVSHGKSYGESLSPAMSRERTLLRLEDLRAVIGVAINPLATLQQNKGAVFDPKNAHNELDRLTRMGFHRVRVELDAPMDAKRDKPVVDFLRDLVTYNDQRPKQATPITVDLLVSFRGSVNNPHFGLDAAEIGADGADPTLMDKQRAYALVLLRRVLAKIPPEPGHQLRNATVALVEQLSRPGAPVSAELRTEVIGLAAQFLGGSTADYAQAFTFKRTVAGVGAQLGKDAAGIVHTELPWLAKYLASVELGNEPEAQWRTPGVAVPDEAARDTAVIDASVAAYGKGAIPAAHEWDPASEQTLLAEIYHAFTSKTVSAESAEQIAPLIAGSGWGRALEDYAAAQGALHKHEPGKPPPHVPLAIHVYNHPMLARALIWTVAAKANKHRIFFDVSITELQIDGATYNKPTPSQLATGVVELGVQVMDEAAAHTQHLAIVQLIAFSYQHVHNVPNQDFGLRGNQPLGALLGER